MSSLPEEERLSGPDRPAGLDVAGGVLVVLILLTTGVLAVTYLRHVCVGNVPLPYAIVDSILFRIAGAGSGLDG